eukprot:scaffold21509_cov75-Cyclotella_meneghiniana.AAC.1
MDSPKSPLSMDNDSMECNSRNYRPSMKLLPSVAARRLSHVAAEFRVYGVRTLEPRPLGADALPDCYFNMTAS